MPARAPGTVWACCSTCFCALGPAKFRTSAGRQRSLPRVLNENSAKSLEHTQQRLPQVRICLRVRNVSPECSTWLNLGSWGWGRLHSNVGHPISKRENPNLVDRNHKSTHRFSGQKMGGEALVPHSLHDLGSRSSPPHIVLLSHWLALLWPPFEMPVSWHPAFLKTSVTNNALCRGRAFERSPFASVSRLLWTVASSTRPQVTVPPPRDATVSGSSGGH